MEVESVSDTAKALNISEEEVTHVIERSKEKLWKYRTEKRPKPHRDDKVHVINITLMSNCSLTNGNTASGPNFVEW